MSDDKTDSDWRLKLRYGKLTTPYIHLTLIGDGRIIRPLPVNGEVCSRAFMRMKVWAGNNEAAQAIFLSTAPDVGFEADGQIYIYETEPDIPPRNTPVAYDIGFNLYNDD
jgi:hypothetical protein